VSVLDEVWTLVDKYYIDRTFNGQDWNQVREKYKYLVSKAKGNQDKETKLMIRVGITLMPNEDKQIIVGAPPIAGSAADTAGMKVGDFVTAVNGIPTEGRTAFDIIDQISENPNANTVAMTVRSKDGGDTFEVTMERAFREVKNPVRYEVSETRADGTKVGFIRILEFNKLSLRG